MSHVQRGQALPLLAWRLRVLRVSGYKPGISETRSPYYAAGYADGQADVSRLADGKDTIGMDPAKRWSAMYQRGYADGMGG